MQLIASKAGFAAEVVTNDYGEDLLVQTHNAGRMDASRLWIQVKSTTQIARLEVVGGYSYTVPMPQALRWARSADPVFVVLWDVAREVGYYANTRGALEDWVQGTAPTRATIHFPAENAFDVAAMQRLAWESRLEHYRALLLDADEVVDPRDLEAARFGRALAVQISLDFLDSIGLVERKDDGSVAVPPVTAEKIAGIHEQFLEDPRLEYGDADPLVGATGIVILEAARRAMGPGVGVPARVFGGAIDAVLTLFDLVAGNLPDEPAAEAPAQRARWRIVPVDDG